MEEKFSKEDFEKIIDAISSVAMGDHHAQIQMKGDNGYYDAISTGINMMIDDLRMGVSKIESERDFTKSIITYMSEILLVTDSSRKIILANPASLRLLGYTEEELIDKPLEILFEDKSSIRLQNYPATDIENVFLTKQGTRVPVLLSASLKKGLGGEPEGVIYVASDIRERIKKQKEIQEHLKDLEKVNAQLREAKRLAEESMMIKEKFLANMSHEIRTPMNAIIGFTNLLLNTFPTEEQKEYIGAIKYSGENLLVIINDILDFSRMESGKLIFEETDFSIRDIMNALILTFQSIGKDRNIKLMWDVASGVPLVLKGDPVRLNQVLTNLLSNALKFTEYGFVKVSVANISTGNESVLLEFIVEDSGIGIPEDKLKDIFASFTQVSSSTTRKYGGTGLGLAITKSIVEQKGGIIEVESKVDKGTKFLVRLPFKEGTTKVSAVQETSDIFHNYNLTGVTALVVDDNKLNQLLAKTLLEKVGCEVALAENGKEAVNAVSAKEFDVILMDIQMPEMDGYEATKLIRALPEKISKVAIIAMTAHAMITEEDKCKAAGMNDYLSKPFTHNSLYNKILKHIPRGSVEIPIETSSSLIDLTYLKGISGGNNKIVSQLINVFIEYTPGDIRQLKLFLEEQQWDKMKNLSHKMKSSYATMGMKELRDMMADIEESCKKNRPDEKRFYGMISKAMEDTFKAVDALKREIQSYELRMTSDE